MTKQEGIKQIQLMHEQKLITRESIIGWYYFYDHKLPKMKPERSFADLVRTIGLWMELTEKGGAPQFPYGYQTDITLPIISAKNERPDLFFGFNMLVIITGLIVLFVNLLIGLSIISIGILSMMINYQLRGGSKNIDTVTSTKEGKKVIEWIEKHSKIKPLTSGGV